MYGIIFSMYRLNMSSIYYILFLFLFLFLITILS